VAAKLRLTVYSYDSKDQKYELKCSLDAKTVPNQCLRWDWLQSKYPQIFSRVHLNAVKLDEWGVTLYISPYVLMKENQQCPPVAA
jgi:hypothetical protein